LRVLFRRFLGVLGGDGRLRFFRGVIDVLVFHVDGCGSRVPGLLA
jgi:hypothetical protein